jgi:hypothetical protein
MFLKKKKEASAKGKKKTSEEYGQFFKGSFTQYF